MRWIFLLTALLLAMGPMSEAVAQNRPDERATYPDWNNERDPLHSALGLHYGQIGGHGLSVRVPLDWFLYLQVSGGIWHTNGDKKHNVGGQLHYLLRQDDRLRLFTSAGLAYFYHKEREGDEGPDEMWDTDSNLNFGAGIGLEYLVGKRWSLQAELDFARTGDNGNITVLPQVGAYFYW